MRYKDVVSLEEITTELSDGLHKAPVFVPHGEYMFVNARNLVNGFIVDVDPEKHTSYEEYCKYKSPIGDRTILYSIDGTIGNLAKYRGEKCVLGKGACYINVKDSVNYDYIYYILQSANFKSYIRLMSTGSTIKHISLKTMRNYQFILPPEPVQQKIAGILKTIDDKIQTNKQINDNLLQQASTIFKHWFTDNPSLDTLEQVPLADLCVVVTKGTTPTTLGKPFVSEGINFIKAESILDNHAIDKDKFAFIDSETNDLLRRSIIVSGDIVFTIAGTLGRFALIDDSVLPANTNQAVAIIRANQSKVTPEYLYSFFLGNWHIDYYTKRIQQAVQANLSLGTIKSLPIPILSDKAMSEYLGIISPIIAMTKANELEITKLRTMRDALLPQLMSGQLDVSNLDL